MAGALRSFPTSSADPFPPVLPILSHQFCPGPIRPSSQGTCVLSSPSHMNQSLLWLTKLVNLLCAGNIPKVLFHIFLVPLSCHAKRRRGSIQVAVEDVLHWLTSKCAARSMLPEALQILSLLQVGVGLPAGCETIFYSISNVHVNSNIFPNHCFTHLMDFSNAFNSADQSTTFHEVRSWIPSIASSME